MGYICKILSKKAQYILGIKQNLANPASQPEAGSRVGCCDTGPSGDSYYSLYSLSGHVAQAPSPLYERPRWSRLVLADQATVDWSASPLREEEKRKMDKWLRVCKSRKIIGPREDSPTAPLILSSRTQVQQQAGWLEQCG